MARSDGLKETTAEAGKAAAAVENLKGKLDGVAGARAKVGGVSQAIASVGESAGKVPAALNAVRDAASAMGTVVGRVFSGDLRGAVTAFGDAATAGVGKVAEKLGTLGPAGEAAGAVLVTLTAIVRTLAGTLLDLGLAAIGVYETRNALQATYQSLAGSEAGGKAVVAMVDRLAASMSFSTAQIGDWAKRLLAAGYRGEQLEAAIKGVAAATAIMGPQGGAAAELLYKKLGAGGEAAKAMLKAIQTGSGDAAEKLTAAGLTSQDLADALGMPVNKMKTAKIEAAQMQDALNKALAKRGAPALANMVTDLSTLMMKLREGALSLFEDLKPAIDPFATALQELASLFYKNGDATKAAKPIVTQFFSTLFGWATKAVIAIKGVVQWLLQSGKEGNFFAGALDVLKAGWAALSAVFGVVKSALAPVWVGLKAIFSNAMVIKGIKGVFTAIVAVITAVVVVTAALGAAFVAAAGIVSGALAAIWGAMNWLIGGAVSVVQAVVSALYGLVTGASTVGSDMVAGLVSAITGGIGAAVGAIVNLVSSVIGGARGAADAHSPSRKMIGLVGKPIGQGVPVGIMAENDNARAAGEASVGAAIAGAQRASEKSDMGALAPAPAAQGAARGPTFQIGSVTIQQPPGATRKEGEEFAVGFHTKMMQLAAEAA